uniref:General secretion pathway protein GspK n=1 Tax=Thermocrinis ruber TaxID=75906 RepID=A0A7C5WZB3_9AQUI
MIPLLALMLFLMSTYYALDAYSATKSAQRVVEEVSFKVQASYVFSYALPLVLDLLRKDDPSVDSLQDNWARELTFRTDRGELRITIYDEDRFLNLNSVDEGPYGKFFERLLRLLAIDPSYKENLLVWTGKSKGTINTDYPIKRAPLDAKEELYYMGFDKQDLLGKELGGKFYPGLLELTTVDSRGKVNINTASLYVLMALDQRIDESLASKIMERRNREPFKKPEDLLMVDGMTLDILYNIKDLIDVKSSTFHIKMELRSRERSAVFEVVYDRQADKILYKKLL